MCVCVYMCVCVRAHVSGHFVSSINVIMSNVNVEMVMRIIDCSDVDHVIDISGLALETEFLVS